MYKTYKIDVFTGGKSSDVGTRYEITGPYCKAFNAKDTSVCSSTKSVGGPWNFDIAKWAHEWDVGK
ncbi:hypothetical protein BO70DRAFT_393881 [Aspergillus heteromorphus CBS 117.55]|uniref:Uncharacterized protein n=1 Tax=Aspergillus heteromorphus CBS 117.55 TaxID=1448321 RepID=A0A317WTA4_9EURO|nr:uncharacterized protein BO70DRAFT_393881 [Aspergillus heteromorphus CBS 117.55]PWY88158.1 hypothetical protein BO70DRAFT_393881 [Aspergillus heteromorphus CBS 117.55]